MVVLSNLSNLGNLGDIRMHLDPEMLAALAGLPPLPRTPLTINPCPEGYSLQLVGGQFTCVLEGVDGDTVLALNQRNQSSGGGDSGPHRHRAVAPEGLGGL